jgi:hypothetical protein
VNIYVTATASGAGTMVYTYGKIDHSTAVAQQTDLGDCDSGEIKGNQLIMRLSIDKLKGPEALGYDVIGKTSTGTEALAQVGVGLLFAADTANGADFTVQ